MSSEVPTLGEELRKERRLARMKQIDVANYTGIPRTRISEYENNHTVPSITNLNRLLKCYGADEETAKRIFISHDIRLLIRPRATRY